MKNWFTCGALCAGLLMMCVMSNVAAGGIIDTFDSPPQFVASFPGLNTSNVIAPLVLGGWRQLDAFGSTGNLTGTTGIFDGHLSYSNGPAGPGTLQVSYTSNNIGLGGGIGTNLFSGGATEFELDVIQDDTIPTLLQLKVEDVLGNISSSTTNIGGSAAGSMFVIPFSVFSGTANFSTAKFLTLSIIGAANADITLDNFKTNTAVPEPSSVAMALTGLVIGGVAYKRRRKTVTA